MADEKVTVVSPDGAERLVFNVEKVLDRYDAMGWKVKGSKPAKKTAKKAAAAKAADPEPEGDDD